MQIGKAHQKLNEQLDLNSVEKMMSTFVETKGTGKEKPGEGGREGGGREGGVLRL